MILIKLLSSMRRILLSSFSNFIIAYFYNCSILSLVSSVTYKRTLKFTRLQKLKEHQHKTIVIYKRTLKVSRTLLLKFSKISREGEGVFSC